METPAFSPSLPFARPLLPQFSKIMERFAPSWERASLTKGGLTEAYETAAADFLKVNHCVAVSSCTTGLVLALRALRLQGECLVPAFTFTSTVQALLWNNLTPVFVDCHPRRFTVDLNALSGSLTPNCSAVVVPYVFGNPPPLDELKLFCAKHRLALILDAAHAFGTAYKGKPAGNHGDAEVFSTSATKLLCTGEGGMISSGDWAFIENVRTLREYGHGKDYEAIGQGLNGRITEFQSLLGLEGLPMVDGQAERRNYLAGHYRQVLKGLPFLFQEIEPDSRSSYKDFAVVLQEEWHLGRDEVAAALEKEGIPTRKYFSPPIHRQKFVSRFIKAPRQLPVTEEICKKILCLPMFHDLKESQIERIGEVFHRLYKEQGLLTRRTSS